VRIRRQRLRNRPTNRPDQKLESLPIDAIAHHDEIDHRIVQGLSGRALLDRNNCLECGKNEAAPRSPAAPV
jgi:hypothetical protein